MKKIIFLLFLLFIPFSAHAQINEFKNAGELYKKGQYKEAIAEYEKVIQSGSESGNLYYDIGNCYFKLGNFGKTILNYERAKKFIPRDNDLKSNYTLAKSRALKFNIPEKKSFLLRMAGLFFEGLTVNELTALLISIYLCVILIFTICLFWQFSKLKIRILSMALILFFLLGNISLYDKIKQINSAAIVITDGAQARFEPFENATVFFELSEGAKIEIIDLKETWLKIKRCDGKIGWINKNSVEKI